MAQHNDSVCLASVRRELTTAAHALRTAAAALDLTAAAKVEKEDALWKALLAVECARAQTAMSTTAMERAVTVAATAIANDIHAAVGLKAVARVLLCVREGR